MSTSATLRVVCLRTAEQLLALRGEINALNLNSSRPDPFSTCEFYVNFLEHADWCIDRARSQLCFLAAFQGEQLLGYLALKEVTRRGWLRARRRVDFLVGHEADRPHVVARPEHVAEVTESFYAYLAARHDWDFLELQQQDDTSTLHHPPATVRLRGCWVGHYPSWDNCTIELRWKSVRDYFESMSRNMRSSLKRRLRALLALGKLELIVSSDPNATPALFELYCDIESRSWKSNTSVAIAGNAARTRYFGALLDRRQPMQIIVHLLLLDGIPIAGLICGSFSGPNVKGLYGLQIAFDRRLSAVAPGSAILLLGVRYAIERDYVFFNLLSGFEYYKTRWLAQSTHTTSVQIYRVGSMLFLRRVCGNLKRALLRRVSVRQFVPQQKGESNQARELRIPSAIAPPELRAHYDALIAQSLHGATEYLSGPEMRATLSFLNSRSADARPGNQPRRSTAPKVARSF